MGARIGSRGSKARARPRTSLPARSSRSTTPQRSDSRSTCLARSPAGFPATSWHLRPIRARSSSCGPAPRDVQCRVADVQNCRTSEHGERGSDSRDTLPLTVTRTPAFLEVCTDLLARGDRVRFRAEGWSMHPTIRHGELITIAALNGAEVSPGDILLYSTGRK